MCVPHLAVPLCSELPGLQSSLLRSAVSDVAALSPTLTSLDQLTLILPHLLGIDILSA